MFRCLVNEGLDGEWMAAGNTREEVEAIVRKSRHRAGVKTKRFFKIKETG